MSVLDLPEEEQKELAKAMGQTHEAWMVGAKARLKSSRKFAQKVSQKDSKLSQQERQQYQAKMDSGNPR